MPPLSSERLHDRNIYSVWGVWVGCVWGCVRPSHAACNIRDLLLKSGINKNCVDRFNRICQ